MKVSVVRDTPPKADRWDRRSCLRSRAERTAADMERSRRESRVDPWRWGLGSAAARRRGICRKGEVGRKPAAALLVGVRSVIGAAVGQRERCTTASPNPAAKLAAPVDNWDEAAMLERWDVWRAALLHRRI